jgi:hypothetical protein
MRFQLYYGISGAPIYTMGGKPLVISYFELKGRNGEEVRE